MQSEYVAEMWPLPVANKRGQYKTGRIREMLNRSDAQQIAQKYVDSIRLPHADYRMMLRMGCELPDEWFFDFGIEHIRGLPPEQWDEQFAGAPGCAVSKTDGSLRDVSWMEFRERGLAKLTRNSN